MRSKHFSLQLNLEETITRIISSRQITVKDKQQLRNAFLVHESLAEDEITLIDRILYGVRHGILEVVEWQAIAILNGLRTALPEGEPFSTL